MLYVPIMHMQIRARTSSGPKASPAKAYGKPPPPVPPPGVGAVHQGTLRDLMREGHARAFSRPRQVVDLGVQLQDEWLHLFQSQLVAHFACRRTCLASLGGVV